MKKMILVLVLLILVGSGCGDVQKNINNDSKDDINITSSNKITTSANIDNDKTITTDTKSDMPITIEDFNINYNNININDFTSFNQIAKELNINLNDINENIERKAETAEYKWFIVHYPSVQNEDLTIEYVINEEKNTEYLVYIELYNAKTTRGIGIGSDLQDLLDSYGEIVEPSYNTENSDYYEYSLDNKYITFIVDKNTKKVTEISIDYNNDKAIEDMDLVGAD